MRVLLGLLILIDLAIRSQALSAHYSDMGILARSEMVRGFRTSSPIWSLHLVNGSALYQGLLFAVAGLFAGGLILGYRTRLCAIGSWLLLVSLHNRNPLVLHSGDVLFRMVLFWCVFLPLGSRYSWDSWREPRTRKTVAVCSFASAALLLQIAMIYTFGVVLKSDPVWTREFSAVQYSLQIDHFVTHLGKFLAGFPVATRWLTAGLFKAGGCLLLGRRRKTVSLSQMPR